jgi:hypothetical protein
MFRREFTSDLGVVQNPAAWAEPHLRAVKSAALVVAVELEEGNRSKSRDVLGRLCSANWYGSKNSVFRAGVAPNAHGYSILQDHPSANRSRR